MSLALRHVLATLLVLVAAGLIAFAVAPVPDWLWHAVLGSVLIAAGVALVLFYQRRYGCWPWEDE